MKATRGDHVRIRWVVLRPEERPDGVPADTRATPFVACVNGHLEGPSASIGDRVRVRTQIGRVLDGELVEIGPRTDHGFGSPQPELLAAGQQLREILP
ncbi:MAG TPA: 2-amino-4-oxopentanoate thiolase subunit OrtA [Candidatus Limnocylindria bacterium]